MSCSCASHQAEQAPACCGSSHGVGPEKSTCCSNEHDHDKGHDHGHFHSHGGADVTVDAGCGCCGHDHGDAAGYSSFVDILLKSHSGRMMCLYLLLLGISALVMFLWEALGNWPMTVALGIGLIPILRSSLSSVKSGQIFSIETLMSIAAVGAAIIGEVQEAAVVILLFQVGEILEAVAARKAQIGIQRLVDMVPQEAQLVTDDGVKRVPAASLAIEDIILVGAGERIAADGVVVHGISDVDEAALTGESLPKTVMAGAPVMAGSVNGQGVLRVQVTRDAGDNSIARVARLVQEAQNRKAPVQRVINRFAQIYTPIIVCMAAGVAVVPPVLFEGEWSTWIYRALAMLLIGCPCALVISTPAALASALSTAARQGVLLKGGDVLEKLATVNLVAFDKTGTLTTGKPHVVDVRSMANSKDDFVAIAAGLSLGNSHPISKAVMDYVHEHSITPATVTGVVVVPGHGVQGVYNGKAVSFGALEEQDREDLSASVSSQAGTILSVVRINGDAVGVISCMDTLRPDAISAVKTLQMDGVKTLILTGDTQANAKNISQELGIDFYAHLRPEGKMERVQQLQNQGHRVLKVGDGINDAPALAAANVGLAFGGGTDVALETADGASLYNRVNDVSVAISLSKAAMRNIRQNIGIALGLKGIFLVTTVVGVTGLWPAILADTGATVLVTLNALRLLRYKD